MIVFKLNFISPLHIGEAGIELQNISTMCHSDTLFSAICHGWIKLFGEKSLQELIKLFEDATGANNDPLMKKIPFRFSSAFPFHGQNFFFPRPLFSPRILQRSSNDTDHRETLKSLKGMEYVPESIFRQLLNGVSNADSFVNEVKECREESKEPGYFGYLVHVLPRVSIDRVNSSSNIFHLTAQFFRKDAGLFILYEGDEYKGKFIKVLKMVGEMGLGGERTYGYGRFTVEETSIDDFNNSGGRYVTLSLFHPNDADYVKKIAYNSQFGLIDRKGFIYSHIIKRNFRKKGVYLFTEGSTFPEKTEGHLVDVTNPSVDPDVLKNTLPPEELKGYHKVHRYGFPFYVNAVGGMDNG